LFLFLNADAKPASLIGLSSTAPEEGQIAGAPWTEKDLGVNVKTNCLRTSACLSVWEFRGGVWARERAAAPASRRPRGRGPERKLTASGGAGLRGQAWRTSQGLSWYQSTARSR